MCLPKFAQQGRHQAADHIVGNADPHLSREIRAAHLGEDLIVQRDQPAGAGHETFAVPREPCGVRPALEQLAKADAVAPTFATGLLLGLSNPKAYLAFVTLFASQTIAAGSTRADATLKWGLIILVIFAVDVAWLYAGARLGRVPVSPRAERSINVVLGVGILAVSVHSLPGFAG
jgi:hypothetical protein